MHISQPTPGHTWALRLVFDSVCYWDSCIPSCIGAVGRTQTQSYWGNSYLLMGTARYRRMTGSNLPTPPPRPWPGCMAALDKPTGFLNVSGRSERLASVSLSHFLEPGFPCKARFHVNTNTLYDRREGGGGHNSLKTCLFKQGACQQGVIAGLLSVGVESECGETSERLA